MRPTGPWCQELLAGALQPPARLRQASLVVTSTLAPFATLQETRGMGGGEDAADAMFALSAEPPDLALAAGDSATLPCGAPSPARLSWRYSASAPPTRDHALPRADTYRKQLSNGSLLIENMSAALAGQYQCVATVDGVGTVVSRVATLFLAEVPELGEAPRVIMGVLGSPALLSCPIRLPARLAVRVIPSPSSPLQPERRVYGAARIHAPPPVLKLNVTWLKNGSPVRMEAARLALTPGGALELDPLRAHDAAAYRCSVTLAHSHRKPSLGPETELRVNSDLANLESAPRFITTPQPVTVMEGASVTFDCAALGNPKPEMVWLNNGVAIDLNDLDSRFYLVGSGSLRVQAARALDAGTYTCRATNRLDSADHSTQLHVMKPTTIPLTLLHVMPRLTHFTRRSSLRIRGVLAADAGVFQCSAASAAGSATAALRLLVSPHDIKSPKTPKNSTQDIFNSLISGVVDQTLDPTPEDLDFLGETSSAYTSEPLYDEYSTLDSYNDSYNSDYNDFHAAQDLDLDLKKANATIVSAPKDLRAVIVKHRFVTLSWQEPEIKQEEVTGYAILYKVKGSERERMSRGESTRHEMNVASLQPNTTYHFKAVAITHHAISPPTQVVEVTTPEEELTYGPPQNVVVEAAGPHALRVSWIAPEPAPPESSPPPPTRYAIYYTECFDTRANVILRVQLSCVYAGGHLTGSRFVELTCSESNSEYVISLRASNALGLGPAVYATVRTKPSEPDDGEPDEPDEPDADEVDERDDEDDTPPLIPPVGLKVIMLSGSTAVVYWTDPTLAKGQTATDGRRYEVRSTGAGRTRVYNASDLNCMIDDLRPFTKYEFAVKLIKEGGEGGGLASATSAWLWASAGGACAVLALAAALALSLCCRRNSPPMSPDTSTYQKASASAAIKPPDLWIHHDQMELKHMDKSLHSSAISAGSVEGSGLVSSTLTLARAPPPAPMSHAPQADYEPARHAPPSLASLDRRYVPTYVAMTGVGVGVGLGVGCTGTCERRRHMPDQSTPLLAGVAPLGSPQSSLASLHPPPAPCGSGLCPLGAACSAPGAPPTSVGSASDVYASASSARERGHYVAYEPLGHYTHRESLSADGERVCGPGGLPGGVSAGGSLSRRGGCGGGLHSFALPDTASDHSTPSHSKAGSVRETSPYKKSASSSPGHLPNRLQLGSVVSHCSEELEPLTPSRSTERLHREMQNLEGLMKDLSAITQNQFHC
ncbi:jg4197 [Pararge aegeria aegeria]|uniref:Hemolin n=1 Tax=Pararge aegeria aegeria TaxID=348720 RepID=A0A8S4R3Q4_9NEOP|nr:jg4197 [Pararge aegeria aegeria]